MDNYIAKKYKNQETIFRIANRLSNSGYQRYSQCGTWLEFNTDEGVKKLRLYRGNFCKNRFCPMCTWRKARRLAVQIACCTQYIQDVHKKSLIFITLTAPNVTSDDLGLAITNYNLAFKRLTKRKEVLKINKGYIRKLEVTYNAKTHTYHPHMHILMAVNKTYFTQSDQYLKRDKWLALWCDCMRDPTISQVYVRKMRSNGNKAILEMSKYVGKDSDIYQSQDVFDGFYAGLTRRQEITYNGLFKDAVKLYKSGDLDKYKLADDTKYIYRLVTNWQSGAYEQYKLRPLDTDELAALSHTVDDCEGIS